MLYRFEECELDTRTREFRRAGELQHLERQVFDVLEFLIRHRDRVVSKIDLLDNVWGDRFVSEWALTSRIKSVRSACGDTGREQRIIRTVHGHGYRFVADTTEGARSTHPVAAGVAAPAGVATRVVGREADIARLESALAAAAAGSRQSAFVTGAPGVGKSTVVAELLERIDDPDAWMVLRGQCLQQRGGSEPYFAVLDALSHGARAAGPEVVDVVDRCAPSWLAQMPSLIDAERAVQLERRLLGATEQRMLREGVEAIEALSAMRPTILTIEDLQWADGWTLDVLELLAQRVEPTQLLLLGTMRAEPGAAADLAVRLASAGRSIEVRLDGLEDRAIDALVADLFGGADVPTELAGLIREHSDGIPLFVREIVSTWIRSGQVEVRDGRVERCEDLDLIEKTVPEGARQLIERELAQLDDDAIITLEAAAVAGTEFDGASTAAGLGRPLAEVEDLLGTLGRDLPYLEALGGSSWPDGTVSTRFAFTHDLYRLAVYERTSAARRAELHEAIGSAIEAGYAGRIDEQVATVAHHFAHSGDTRRAVTYLRRAGEQAAARSAHDHAAAFLLDALDRVRGLPAGSERDEAELIVRMSLGPTLVATRGWFGEEVSENYERAMSLCADPASVCDTAALARFGLATVTELRGEYERTAELLVPLIADDTGDLAVEAKELMACSAFHQGAFETSLGLARTVIETGTDDEVGSALMARLGEHPHSSCNSWASLACWFLGRSDESLTMARTAIEVGESHLYALSTARQQRAFLHQLRNEPDECDLWAAQTIALAEEQGYPMRVLQAKMLQGWVRAVSGEPVEGADLIAATLSEFRSVRVRLTEPYFLALEAEARLLAGDLDRADSLLREAWTSMRETTRTFFYEPELSRLEAQVAVARGDAGAIDDARAALDRSLAAADRLASPPLMLRTANSRLALELHEADPAPWRERVEALLVPYEGQAEIPDTRAARELLAAAG